MASSPDRGVAGSNPRRLSRTRPFLMVIFSRSMWPRAWMMLPSVCVATLRGCTARPATQLGERCAARPRTCCRHHPSRRSPQRAIVTLTEAVTHGRRGGRPGDALRFRHLLQKPQYQALQLGRRQTINILGQRHAHKESDSRRLENLIIIPMPRLLPLLPFGPLVK
jgi:hypothetical protein